MSAASAAVFLLLPVIVGAMVDDLGLSQQQAGYTVSSYFGGYTLVCLSGYFWIRKVSWRKLAIVGYALLVFGLLASGWVSAGLMLIVLFMAGVGAGILLGLGVTLISDMENPDRLFGFQMLSQQVLSAILLLLIPILFSAIIPFKALMLFIAVSLACTGLSIIGVPDKGIRKSNSVQSAFSWQQHWPVLMSLVSLGLYFSALSAIWAFVERFAVSQSLSAEQIGSALGIAMLGGAAGGLLAVVLAGRFKRRYVLLCTSVIFVGVFAGYGLNFTAWVFTVVTVTFSFTWNICMAFQLGQVAALDLSGRYSVLVPAAIAAGAMIGPVVGGTIVELWGYKTLLLSMSFALLVFTLPFLWVPESRHQSSNLLMRAE